MHSYLRQNIKKIKTRSPSKFCDLKLCVDEVHFILICAKYDEIRHCKLGVIYNTKVTVTYILTIFSILNIVRHSKSNDLSNTKPPEAWDESHSVAN